MSVLTPLTLKGHAVKEYLPEVATLRIKVFKEYPYLYEGKPKYEQEYLQTYFDCPESFVVLIKDGDRVVGASTSIPLEFETKACKQPFIEQKQDIASIYYLGESILLPEYRGRGVYRTFFEQREHAARECGAKIATFCCVQREPNDPRRPKDYVPLNDKWRYFGYEPQPDLRTFYEWPEVGSTHETPHPMMFWLKTL